MPIIRKKLTPDELNAPNKRYNETSEEFEVWNGSEWIEDATIDPRVDPSNQLPPRITADTKCDAAKSMVEKIHAGINTLSTGVGYSVVGSEIFIFLTSLLVGVGLIASFVITAAVALVNIGITTILAALTEGVYDELENIIYCLLDENGQFTDSAFTELGVQLNADIGGDAGVVLNVITQLMGSVGLNNAGSQGVETGDCTGFDCEWYVEFDFTQGDTQEWLVLTDATLTYGAYLGNEFKGIGQPTQRQILVWAAMAGIHITSLSIDAYMDHGSGLGNFTYIMDMTALPPATATWNLHHQGGLPSTASRQWTGYAPLDITLDEGIGLYFAADGNGSGFIHLYKIRLGGDGEPPSIGARVSTLIP